ncbi:hypothetical protein DAPK24_055020 [Pichia kluyveri]|uniref:PSP1 C-terminal domain-containing protein n=1 Tax=Pichia kluyveri TaxID=36015 RepID=A0AAV5RE92_PICKL|nr:hypothetical protein DAPK24_055020 [Pichia kluyveri]
MLLNKNLNNNSIGIVNSGSGNSETPVTNSNSNSVAAAAAAVANMSLSDDKPNLNKNNTSNNTQTKSLFSTNFEEETLQAALEMDERSRLSSEGSFVPFPATNINAQKYSTVKRSSIGSINTNYKDLTDMNFHQRSSFDANSKLGSLSHSNDHHKSPQFLTAFDFKQPLYTNVNTNININDAIQPPLTSSSLMLSLSNGLDGFDGGISPLTPQKHIFSDFNSTLPNHINTNINNINNINNTIDASLQNYLNIPPLSQESLTSPISNEYTHNASPSRLSHHSSNSNGFLSNIDEITSQSINNASLSSESEGKVRTKSVFDDIWNDNKDLFGKPPKTVPNETTFSPTNDNANINKNNSHFRRFSYDATTAATFVPHSGDTINDFLNPINWNNLDDKTLNNLNNINNMKMNVGNSMNINNNHVNNPVTNNLKPSDISVSNNGYNYNYNYNYNYDNYNQSNNYRKSDSYNMYSRNSSLDNSYGLGLGMGMNFGMGMNNIPNTSALTNEQLVHFMTQVSTYLGFPSSESLNIESYLSYLNNASLPQLTIPSDLLLSNDYEIIACCFKNSRIDVFYINQSDKLQFFPNLKIGDLVIVEADRGRDLGKVVKLNVSILETRLLRYAQYLGRKAALSKDDDHKKPILNFPKPILRLAQNEELLTVDSKIEDEMRAVEVCQHKVREFGLNMAIVDAEYQWDMKKLTFYYNSEVRIDFRDLVKELFRIYKIRIWMSKKDGIC